MKASQARYPNDPPMMAKPCEICGKKSLPYGFTQSGQVCSRVCSDISDKQKGEYHGTA